MNRRSGGQPPVEGKPGGTGGEDNPGWAIFGYLLSGMAVYGGIGWLIGRWAGHSSIFLAVGMVVGLALAITLIIFRYGRS
jgi:ATP synthase protein I